MIYPNVRVKLSGEDSNAFAILGRVVRAMRKAGVPEGDVKRFSREAMSGSYDHLLRTTIEWVDAR